MNNTITTINDNNHCVKSIRSIYIRIRTEYREIRRISPNAGKYGPEKAPYLDTFHTVNNMIIISVFFSGQSTPSIAIVIAETRYCLHSVVKKI